MCLSPVSLCIYRLSSIAVSLAPFLSVQLPFSLPIKTLFMFFFLFFFNPPDIFGKMLIYRNDKTKGMSGV